MMITVKYFAGLRERLGRDRQQLAVPEKPTVAEVWRLATGGETMPQHTLSSVNLEFSGLDQAVKDGDEVAFFPPVTGG